MTTAACVKIKFVSELCLSLMLDIDFVYGVRILNLGLPRELFDPRQKTMALLNDRVDGNTSEREESPKQ